LREFIALVTAGFSEATVLSLDWDERLAWCVIIGEQNGGEFDWKSLRWKERT
jgi:hypothetical protein